MAKPKPAGHAIRPFGTIHLNRPSKKAIDCDFTDFADVTQLIADEFNVLASGHPLLSDTVGYTAEQVADDLAIAVPELAAYMIESQFGRGFLLGQGMLTTALKENPNLLGDEDDEDGD